jgi:acyl-CoA synthetase (NDP forming)
MSNNKISDTAAMLQEATLHEASRKVEALLNPKNVVIMGATDKPGNWPARVWRNLKRYDYPGAVFPFNPGREQIWDTRCYRSFDELPEPPDHLVVLIPAAHVPDALTAAAKAGARSATIMTSGFGEADDAASRKIAARLKAVIEETGLAVSGPNCLGNLHAPAKLMTMPDDRPQRVAPGPVAIISQSGGVGMAIKRTLEERGIDTSTVVTSGNETGLSTADYIAYFATAPDIRVIVSYLEAVHEPEQFLAACRLARDAGKPVIVAKLGASMEGRTAALAHTGSLAGSMEAFEAIAGPAGAIRVRTLDDIVEAVELVLHAPLPKGKKLGGITFSGALRGLLLDGASANGLSFPALAPATVTKLKALLSVGTIVGNPLDSGFAALSSAEAYIRCVEIMLGDPNIDLLLLQEELPRAPGTERKEANLRAVNELAAKAKKPIVFVSMISYGLTDYSRTLREQYPHLPFLQEIDKTTRAARSICDYAGHVTAAKTQKPILVRRTGAAQLKKVLAAAPASKAPSMLNEADSKALLKAYGLTAPQEGVAHSAKEAAKIAKSIGFPVVAKGLSAAVGHKSDIGGVILHLDSPKAVREAYEKIEARFRKHAKGKLEGVIIAEQVTGGVELVLGSTRDPEAGPVILFGTGGVNLELYRDVALAAAPLDERAANALIDKTKAGQLIDGYRGSEKLDRKAVVKALIGLSHLVADAGAQIDSIDINPFLVRKRGGVALDALVVLAAKP